MLDSEEIAIVQSDWEKVVPIANQAATLFYDRLFTLDPSLRTLFVSDLEEQKTKLVKMLTLVVRGLDKLGDLVPAVQSLGRRHVGYGVQAQHYDTVGAALLWTLKQGLGDGFDAQHEAIWAKTYGVLAKAMIEAPA